MTSYKKDQVVSGYVCFMWDDGMVDVKLDSGEVLVGVSWVLLKYGDYSGNCSESFREHLEVTANT